MDHHRGSKLLAAFLVLALGASTAAAKGFSAEVDGLYGSFAGAVGSEEKLDALHDRSKALEKQMRDHKRAHRSELSDAEKDELDALDDDVDALQGAIRVVGQLSNTANTSLEDFDRAMARLGLESSEIHPVEAEVVVIQVDVGDYRSILLRNGSKRNLMLMYAWETPGMERAQQGVGNARCERVVALSSRLHSREHDLEGLAFTDFRVRDLGATSKSLKACD